MTRNLKILGLALAAMFAMSAMAASAAQAEPAFTGYETPGENHVHTFIEGTTEEGTVEKYVTAVGTIECHVTYEGTSLTGTGRVEEGGTQSELTVAPVKFETPGTTGEHCNANVFGTNFKADINRNSCDYRFHVNKKLKADEYTGTVDVHCDTAGDFIDIKITKAGSEETKCTIKVFGNANNQGLSHVIYRNEREPAGETHVTVEARISKENGKAISYTTEGGLLNCGQSNGEHLEGSEYEAEDTVAGFNTAGNPVDLEVSGE